MAQGCGDAASCEGAMVVAGALPQSHFALAVGRGRTRGRAVAAPKSSAWLFPVELVKALLNELASVKVNEVSKLGKGAGGGSSGVSSRMGAEKPPVRSVHQAGARASSPLLCGPCRPQTWMQTTALPFTGNEVCRELELPELQLPPV